MVRSFAFTTKGALHSKDIELFLMPTLLSDTKLFLWVDLEDPTPQETDFLLKNIFHFHPLSIEDSVTESPLPKVEEYLPKEKDESALAESCFPCILKSIWSPNSDIPSEFCCLYLR